MTDAKVEEKPKLQANNKTKDLPSPPPPIVPEPGPDGEVYETSHKLGQGGFACCYAGSLQRNSRVFALKIVKSKMQHRKMQEKFRTELQIHSKMRHPNIVEFFRAFPFGENTYVVLELCSNGSLMEMVKARTHLSLPEVRRFMIQLCGGVKYMHQRAVIHRDLKMGNLFLDSKMNLKIGDFGLAALIVSEKDRRQTLCGTPNYIAPEILEKGEGHTHKVDTWAIGVICYAMLTGTPPFVSKTQEDIYRKVKVKDYAWPSSCQNFIPQSVKELVGACLNLVPKERPEMDDLVELDFFKSGAVAGELDAGCKKSKPSWLLNADPRGDKVEPGYGVDHSKICAECGVGRDAHGRQVSSVGENANRTAIAECETERLQGLTPQFPIPEGTVYKQFNARKEDWSSPREYTVVLRDSAAGTRIRKRVAFPTEDGKTVKPEIAPQPRRFVDSTENDEAPSHHPQLPAGTMRRDVQSFAATQRQQHLPTRTRTVRTRTEGQKEHARPETAPENVPLQTRGLLRDLPVRSASSTTTRNTSRSLRSRTVPAGLPKSNTIAGSLDQVPSTAPSKATDNTDSNDAPAIKSIRRRAVKVEALEEAAAARLNQAGLISKTEDDGQTVPKKSEPRSLRGKPPSFERMLSDGDMPVAPERRFKKEGILIRSTDNAWPVESSKPDEIIAYLSKVVDCLRGRRSAHPTRHPPPGVHPIVEKWVDYTNKYGIGYVLNDGTLGSVCRSEGKPPSCAVIRDGKKHIAARHNDPKRPQPAPQNGTPVELYETVGEEGTRQVLEDPSKYAVNYTSGEDLHSLAQRFKTSEHDTAKYKAIDLVNKFGLYMTKQFSLAEVNRWAEPHPDHASFQPGKFLKFYQKVGNVGVWGYGDGGLQFNFPDHTKLVVSRNGEWVDYYHLQPDDAVQLSVAGIMSSGALDRRDRFSAATHEVLQAKSVTVLRYRQMLEKNQFREKLEYVAKLVERWIENGGPGQMGMFGARERREFLWHGLREKEGEADKRRKLVWVTVGCWPVEMDHAVLYA